MIKYIALTVAILVGGLFTATQVEATGLSLRLGVRGVIRNALINRNAVVVNRFGQRVVVNQFGQRVFVNNNFNRFGQRVVINRFGQAVVIDNFGRSFVQRNVFVQPQRNLRIVEVPNLGLRSNLVVVRDRFGRVVDVRRQNVVELQRFRSRNQGRRIIIEQNIIRGR